MLILQTETDVAGVLQSVGSRQPDDERVRLGEVAGAPHADTCTVHAAFQGLRRAAGAGAAGRPGRPGRR